MSDAVLTWATRAVAVLMVAAGVVTATEPWWRGAGSWVDTAVCVAVGVLFGRIGVALWRGEEWP